MTELWFAVNFLVCHSLLVTGLLIYILFILYSFNKKLFKHNYKSILKREAKLQKILNKYMEKLLCDRIALCQFHNRDANLQYMKFIKFSVTNEVVRHGTVPMQDNFCDVLLSKFTKLCEILVEKGEIFNNSEDMKSYTETVSTYIKCLDLKSIIVLPIKYKEEYIGFIAIQYVHLDNFGNQDRKLVERYAYELLGAITESISRDIK